MNKTNMSQTRLAKKLKVETIDDAMKKFLKLSVKNNQFISAHHVTDCYGTKVFRSSQLTNTIKSNQK